MQMEETLWDEATDEREHPDSRRLAEKWAKLIAKAIHGKTVAGVTKTPVVILTEEENDACLD